MENLLNEQIKESHLQYLQDIALNTNSCCEAYAEEVFKAGWFLEEETKENLSKRIQLSASWWFRSIIQHQMAIVLHADPNDPYFEFIQVNINEMTKHFEISLKKFGKLTAFVITSLIFLFEDTVPAEDQKRYGFIG